MKLKIIRGANLVAMDNNILTDNSSDPYCKVYVDGIWIGRTPVQHQTLNPIFGGPMSTYRITGDERKSKITVQIFDHDELKSDDPMGQVSFSAFEVLTGGSDDEYPNVWLPVKSTDGCECSGTLQVRLLRASNSGPRVLRTEMSQSAFEFLTPGPKLTDITKSSLREVLETSTAPVTLHVYDVSLNRNVANLNAVSRAMGIGGAFHAALEVYGKEYSFGGSERNVVGMFSCRPRRCPMYRYRESIFLGDCDLSPLQVQLIISKMAPEWMAPSYDLLRKNCCSFAKEFAIELGVGSIPEWVYSLANLGAAAEDFSVRVRAQETLIEKSSPKFNTRIDGISNGARNKSADTAQCIGSTAVDHVMASRLQRAYRSSRIIGRPSSENHAYHHEPVVRSNPSARVTYGRLQDSCRASYANIELSIS